MGDEDSAEKATQAAFDDLYRNAAFQVDRFRYEVLRRVLLYCQNKMRPPSQANLRGAVHEAAGSHGIMFQRLRLLKESQRSAAVLVDVMGLDYDEAARVLGSSKKQVGKLLAQARLNLTETKAIQ
jgi:DNA-directed RNA polymerase specialized sigma24 family protein